MCSRRGGGVDNGLRRLGGMVVGGVLRWAGSREGIIGQRWRGWCYGLVWKLSFVKGDMSRENDLVGFEVEETVALAETGSTRERARECLGCWAVKSVQNMHGLAVGPGMRPVGHAGLNEHVAAMGDEPWAGLGQNSNLE
ncbi:hypothetical protein Tco_1318209 [Tanacetum coccineum]